MTYWEFHLYLIAPAVLLGVLGWIGLAWTSASSSRPTPFAELGALGLLAGIAFCYTFPWDRLLIQWEVWTYDVGRVSATVWGVPIEECAFFVLQTILAGSWYAIAARLTGPGPFSPTEPERSGSSGPPGKRRGAPASEEVWSGWGGLFGVGLTVLGVGLVLVGRGLYLGMILLWSGPVLALQWGLWGRGLWQHRGTMAPAVGAASLYLWIADRIALGAGIWHITPRYTVGLSPFGLPVEEALFFFLTSLLVVQGLVMLAGPGDE